MTNLSERLDKHLQSIREAKEINFEGAKVLVDPNKSELDQLFKDNERVLGYVMSVFQGKDKPLRIVHSIWYGITGKEEFPGGIAYDLREKLKLYYEWPTELEVNTKTREVEYCSSFQASDDGVEAGDGILSKLQAINWAKLHEEIATKYGVKWLHKYRRYINNWAKGKCADGSDVDEDNYGMFKY